MPLAEHLRYWSALLDIRALTILSLPALEPSIERPTQHVDAGDSGGAGRLVIVPALLYLAERHRTILVSN